MEDPGRIQGGTREPPWRQVLLTNKKEKRARLGLSAREALKQAPFHRLIYRAWRTRRPQPEYVPEGFS
jgi:hypothetical protein